MKHNLSQSRIEELKMQYDHMSPKEQNQFKKNNPVLFRKMESIHISYHMMHLREGERQTGQSVYSR